ncbi:hypothetical protein ACERIM_14270 [Natrinema sp. H-ect1]|uniref:hypothetical protein n=1 Tax=Natrinema sp. H-ect1 TaxID=3242700 RepID=UPI00359D3C4D
MPDLFEIENSLSRKAPTSTPKYEIVPSTNKISVSKGEKATLRIYLTGYGEIERHKLTMFLEYDSLLSGEGGNFSIPFAKNEDGGISYGKPAIESDDQFVREIEGNSTTVYITDFIFFDSPAFEFPDEKGSEDWMYPVIISEGDWGKHAPIEVELNIDEDAEPGDYDFQMFLMYSDRLESYQSSTTVKIHVQSKVEEYEPWPQRFAIFGALVALASLIYQTGFFALFW